MTEKRLRFLLAIIALLGVPHVNGNEDHRVSRACFPWVP